MKNCLFTAFLLIGMLGTAHFSKFYAQQTVIDSLRRVLQTEEDPEQRIEHYESIAKEMKELNLASAKPYVDTLEKLANQANSLRGKAKALNLRANILKEEGQLDEALPLFQQNLAIRLQLNDQKGMAQAYNSIGAIYAEQYKPDSTIYYYLKAAAINEQLGDYSNVASGYSNIGNLYSDQQVPDKAIAYLEKAIKIRLEHGEEKKAMYTYNNLAVAYGKKGTKESIEKALLYSKKGIAIALKYDNKFVAGVIEGGICHLLNEQKRYEEAILHCQQSIQYLEETKRLANLVFPLVNLATAYNALNQPIEALKYAEKGYAIMVEKKIVDPLEVYYEELANANEKLGNHKQALFWFKQFMALDDSLFTAENLKNLADVETKYQTEKKEKELITQKAQNFRQRTWLIALVIGFTIFIAFSLLFYNRYRLKQQQILNKAIIREQKLGLNAVIEAQEAEQGRIAKELHDGIAQELVVIKLGFDRLALKMKNVAPNEAENANELSNLLNETCTEVRNISHLLLPPTLEKEGLVSSLQLLLENSLKKLGIAHEFNHSDVNERFDSKVELAVYRIAQELINNILKHAQATQIGIALQKANNNLIFKVEDDGNGYDFEEARHKGSLGLLNILSRVSNLGGNFIVKPKAQRGTVSLIQIPL
jgi:two-component system NarL family sensor kinase